MIGGLSASKTIYPTSYQVGNLRALTASSSGHVDENASVERRTATILAMLADCARNDEKLSYCSGDLTFITHPIDSNIESKSCPYAFYSKGAFIYALFEDHTIHLPTKLFDAIDDVNLLQIAIYAQTFTVGHNSLADLNITEDEIISVSNRLVELNMIRPSSGISIFDRDHIVDCSLLKPDANCSHRLCSRVTFVSTARHIFDFLDIAPTISPQVRTNALYCLADLRISEVFDRFRSFYSTHKDLKDTLEVFGSERGKEKARTQILLAALGSSRHYTIWNNLSIEALCGDLIGEYGDSVGIVTERAVTPEKIDLIVGQLPLIRADIVGLSIEPGSLHLAEHFIDKYNRIQWETHEPTLVLGNQVPTYSPEVFIEDPRFAAAILCIHEGELAMRGLVRYVRHQASLDDVPNIMYRDRIHGSIVTSAIRNIDLSLLPHPPSLRTIKPGSTNMVQASRGCIFNCSYCTRWQTWGASRKRVSAGSGEGHSVNMNWRAFELQRVFENIEIFLSNSITEIEFCDDEFFGGFSSSRLSRILQFADGLLRIQEKYQAHLKFRIFTTPYIITRGTYNRRIKNATPSIRDALIRLKQAGLVRVYVGLESGCEHQRVRYNRKETSEDIEIALGILRDLDLDIDVGFIMFDPYVSVDELIANTQFFRENNLIKHNTWPFRPLVVNAGTAIMHTLAEDGLLTGERDLSFFSYSYRYANDSIDRIATTVKMVSTETAPIFLALKAISKQHWRGSHVPATVLAQELVEHNGLIYLDLMEDLARNAYSKDFSKQSIQSSSIARAEIQRLVSRLEESIDNGVFDGTPEDKFALIKAIEQFYAEYGAQYPRG